MTNKKLHILLVIVFGFLISSCNLTKTQQPVSYQSSSVTDSSEAVQITFWAQLPAVIPPEDTVNLVIQDEVTGLPYNQTRVEMAPLGNGLFGVMLKTNLNSVIKYHYERISSGKKISETTLNGVGLRYRLFSASAPGETLDQIAAWGDSPPSGQIGGRIEGRVIDANTGIPLADIMVTAGGLQTITDGSGQFTLYPLPPGKHTLVSYALDGSYRVFQQQAIVAENAATPTELPMQASSWLNVTFIVSAPENTVDGAAMRMAGNLVQLGNTFSDLGGGVSGDVNQMPQMTYNGDGYYSLKIRLPAETEILYKYTLGDGFWNCEHDAKGNYFTHRLFLPAVSDPILIQDEIATWKTSKTADIWFSVTAPGVTPANDQVSIQFQLANWMPGLPMYRIGDNQWVYPLISPQNFAGAISYRYCRNGQCSGSLKAGAELSGGVRETTTQFSESALINDEIISWTQFEVAEYTVPPPGNVSSRGKRFVAGVIFSPYYSPTWDEFIEDGFAEVRETNANLVVISPSWVAVGPSMPLLFSPQLGATPRWHETAHSIEVAHNQGLQAGLFPQMRFLENASAWWQAADTDDENWWLAWFEQYRDFIIPYAVLAEKTEAESLILGGDWVLPTLPIADNAATFNLPGTVESLWLDIINEVRTHYHGTIAWHIPVSMLEQAPISILQGVDQIYLQWDTPLTTTSGSSVESMASQATVLMELYIQPFYKQVDKPIILSLAYPSAVGSDIYCIPTSSSDPTCLDPTPLLQGPVANLQPDVDLQVQADLYAAVLSTIEYQKWIKGVVTQGWYPPLQLHDASASIHGKPAQDLLAEWYRQLLGN